MVFHSVRDKLNCPILPMEFWMKPKPIVTRVGECITIKCRLIAHPHPQLSVYLNTGHLSQSRRVQLCIVPELWSFLVALVITEVNATDHGTLTFVASNHLTTASCSTQISVVG